MTIKNTDELLAELGATDKHLIGSLGTLGDEQAYRIGQLTRAALVEAGIDDPRSRELHAALAVSLRTLAEALADAAIELDRATRVATALAEHVQKSGRREFAQAGSFHI